MSRNYDRFPEHYLSDNEKYLIGAAMFLGCCWTAGASFLIYKGNQVSSQLIRELFQCSVVQASRLNGQTNPRDIANILGECTDLGTCSQTHVNQSALCNITCAAQQLVVNMTNGMAGDCQSTTQANNGQTEIFAGAIMLIIATAVGCCYWREVKRFVSAMFCSQKSAVSPSNGNIQEDVYQPFVSGLDRQ